MGYIKTMEYYSAVKKNEILPLAATLMDLGSVKCFSGSLVVKKKKTQKKQTNKKNLLQETRDVGEYLGQEDPLKEGMATHSSIFAWKIPWKEEPDRLWSIRAQRVGHN